MTEMIADFIGNNWISTVGAVIGLLYLYFEYKARIWMWPASILMAVFYIYIFYSTRLYASMGIYVCFFLASVYGWVRWLSKDRREGSGEHIITQMDRRYVLAVIAAVFTVFVILYTILARYSSNQEYITVGDAFTTSLNIIALWMASRKWAEQWLLLIPANIISSCLLYVQGDIMSTCLFLVFFIVSVFGYFKWRRMSLKPLKEIAGK